MKKVFLLILVFGAFHMNAFGQTEADEEMKQFVYGNPFNFSAQHFITHKKGLYADEDYYYHYDDWMKGIIYMKDSVAYAFDSINYSLQFDQIMVSLSGEVKAIANTKFRQLEMENGDNFIPVPKTTKSRIPQLEIHQLLFTGKNMALLEDYDLKEVQVNNNPMGIAGNIKKEVKRRSQLLYSTNHGRIKKLPKKKKDFLGIFGRHKSDILTYVRQNNLKINSNTDLVEIFAYHDELSNNY